MKGNTNEKTRTSGSRSTAGRPANRRDVAERECADRPDHPGLSTAAIREAGAGHPQVAGQQAEPQTKGAFGTTVTGAKRESIGTKTQTHLVPYEAILAMARGLNYGAEKYGAGNYKLGLSMLDLLMSIERHCRALMNGEWIDADSQLKHVDMLASSVAMLCQNISSGAVIWDVVGRHPHDLDIWELAAMSKSTELAAAQDRGNAQSK